MSSKAPPEATTELEPALKEILGESLAAGDAAYAVDGLTPRFVATPTSVEQLASVVALADEHRAAVIPWGAGRHMALGNAPSRYDLALRTAKLDRVLEYEPADLTVTVEAGITIGRLQALLAVQGQFLPIDAPGEATIGGVLAAGVSGTSRHSYGLPRDWLLGCRVAHTDGTVSKGGGRVVKNVAGYDMPKLSVGALGTLGIIVEATFKVAPLPAAQETLLASYSSLEAAAEAIFAADARGLALRGAALRQESPDQALAALWLAGPRTAVERSAGELRALAGEAKLERLVGADEERWWAELSEADVAAEESIALRASLPPSAVVGFLQHLAALRNGAAVATLAYPTTGLVLARLVSEDAAPMANVIAEARRQVTEAGGSLVVVAAPVAVKQRVDVWGDGGAALPTMRRLKEQFDPRGTLSPGRFVGGL